jgi:hypothetical protein
VSDNLRAKYDELVRASDTAKQKELEARAQHAAILARKQDVQAELKALGIDDPTQLDVIITNEEQAIAAELLRIAQQLKDIDSGNIEPPPQKPNPSKVVDLDELLSTGSQ